MVVVFFSYENEVKSVEISNQLYERLRNRALEINFPIPNIVKEIYEESGNVSEELIYRYLRKLGY